MTALRQWLSRLLPEPGAAPAAEQLRSALAAALAVVVVVLLSHWLLAAPFAVVAAVGASAVLVFAMPASPLGQPWAVLGGYLVSSLAGVGAAQLVASPPLAAALAVGLATFGMLALRCMHPPGGAVAMFAVLGGTQATALGWSYVLMPVLPNALLVIAVALIINNLIPGRRYPRPHPEINPHRVADPEPMSRLGLRHDDLRAALVEYGRPLYIGSDELDEVIGLAERHAWRRRFGDMRCGDLMTRDVITATPQMRLSEAWGLLRRHQLVGMPVVDAERRMVGCVTLDDFVRAAKPRAPAELRRRLWALLGGRRRGDSRVADIMAWHGRPVRPDTPALELVPLMTRRVHQVPVVDEQGRLAGVVTQSDLIGALYHGRLAETDSAVA